MRKIVAVVVAIAGFTFCTGSAFAQASLEEDRILVGGSLGFGGEGDIELELDNGAEVLTGEEEWEYLLTPGVFAEYDYAASEFFQIGGRLGLNWWQSEELEDADKEGRDILVDIAVVPKVRYRISGSGIEIFGAVPVGLAVAVPHEDWEDQANGATIDTNPATGWMVGVRGGVLLDLEALLLFADMGWTRHQFTYDFDFVESADASLEIEVIKPQFGLSVGMAFGL